jgi:flavin-dependent dehydrogenase
MSTRDAVVVGAGPAGSLVARSLALAGASVLLVDRDTFPRWKVCGGCLHPAALSALNAAGLGDLPARLGAVPLSRVLLSTTGAEAALPLAGNVSLSRSAFDAALVDEAVAAGVEFRCATSAAAGPAEVRGDSVVVRLRAGGSHADVHARVVVDATGLAGTVGTVRPVVSSSARIGVGAVFTEGGADVQPGDLRMVVGDQGYVGLVLDQDGALTVGAALDASSLSGVRPEQVVNGILQESGLPPLPTEPARGWKGTPPLARGLPSLAEHRLFRLGDAAGYVEPFTGEGMAWALRSALVVLPLVQQSIERWDDALIEQWRRTHANEIGRSQRPCRLVTSALRHRRLVRAGVKLVAVSPSVARPFIGSASTGMP